MIKIKNIISIFLGISLSLSTFLYGHKVKLQLADKSLIAITGGEVFQGYEYIDLEEKDIILWQTFDELLTSYLSNGPGLIVALVTVKDNVGSIRHIYYDAFSLNKTLFYHEYNIMNTREFNPIHKLDPYTRLRIVAPIFYFSITEKNQEKAIFIGTEHDLVQSDLVQDDVSKNEFAHNFFKAHLLNTHAQWLVAEKYAQENNFYEAEKYYRCAAQDGHVKSSEIVGQLSEKCEKYDEAVYYYAQAITDANKDEMIEKILNLKEHIKTIQGEYGLAVAYDWQKNKEVNKFYKSLADQAYAPAQNKLGKWYEIHNNLARAKTLFQLAVDQNHIEACYNLALICEREGDLHKTKELLTIAANKDHTKALYKLGLMNIMSDNVDWISTKELFTSAAYQGHAGAQALLAAIFFKELEFEQSQYYLNLAYDQFEEAKAYLEKCHSCIISRLALGFLYEKEGNLPKAKELFILLVHENNADAQIKLGLIYAKLKDLAAAETMFKLAAMQNHSCAFALLSEFYCNINNSSRDFKSFVQSAKHLLALFHNNPHCFEEIIRYLCFIVKNSDFGLYALARMYYLKGDIEQWKHYFRLAASKDLSGGWGDSYMKLNLFVEWISGNILLPLGLGQQRHLNEINKHFRIEIIEWCRKHIAARYTLYKYNKFIQNL